MQVFLSCDILRKLLNISVLQFSGSNKGNNSLFQTVLGIILNDVMIQNPRNEQCAVMSHGGHARTEARILTQGPQRQSASFQQ